MFIELLVTECEQFIYRRVLISSLAQLIPTNQCNATKLVYRRHYDTRVAWRDSDPQPIYGETMFSTRPRFNWHETGIPQAQTEDWTRGATPSVLPAKLSSAKNNLKIIY